VKRNNAICTDARGWYISGDNWGSCLHRPFHTGTKRFSEFPSGTSSQEGINDQVGFFEQVVAVDKLTPGPDHPNTLNVMQNLAAAYDAAGRRREALDLREEVFERRKATLYPDHPDTLEVRARTADGRGSGVPGYDVRIWWGVFAPAGRRAEDGLAAGFLFAARA
jgi:hypothetical protein